MVSPLLRLDEEGRSEETYFIYQNIILNRQKIEPKFNKKRGRENDVT